jgi:hypothetical protein
MLANPSPLTLIALACACISTVILLTYLIVRPPLRGPIKLWLMFGLGVFPIGTAAAGNLQGFEASKERMFCASCHVMVPHTSDSDQVTSASLASRHARNELFGHENCYACHADYGMFGTVLTKLGGMRHVWMYVTQYRHATLEEAKQSIHLYEPYPNANCMHCHSTEVPVWSQTPDHRALLQDLRAGRVSCASSGCHGFAHPFSKTMPTGARPLSGPVPAVESNPFR